MLPLRIASLRKSWINQNGITYRTHGLVRNAQCLWAIPPVPRMEGGVPNARTPNAFHSLQQSRLLEQINGALQII